AAGHEVSIVDILSTGNRRNVNPAATFYEADIRSPGLAEIFAAARPEIVDHHAAHAEVRESVEDPVYDADVNVLGSINLFQQCVRGGVRKVIFISSGGAVYGEPQALPCAEGHPIAPLSPYGASKAAVELYLFLYRQTYGLDYTALRYANVYGPRQDLLAEEGRVGAIFSQRMLEGREPTINGDGEEQRSAAGPGDHPASAGPVAGPSRAVNLPTVPPRPRDPPPSPQEAGPHSVGGAGGRAVLPGLPEEVQWWPRSGRATQVPAGRACPEQAGGSTSSRPPLHRNRTRRWQNPRLMPPRTSP